MTFQEKFDELKAKYGKVDEAKLAEPFAVQIEMTDDDCGGIFYVAYVGGVFSVEPYDYRDNTAAVRVSSEVLEKLLSAQGDPAKEFLAGKIKVDGKTDHALMVIDLMKKEAPKKRVAKKAAAKKAEEKPVEKAEEKPAAKTALEKAVEKVVEKAAEKKTTAKKAATKKSASKAKK